MTPSEHYLPNTPHTMLLFMHACVRFTLRRPSTVSLALRRTGCVAVSGWFRWLQISPGGRDEEMERWRGVRIDGKECERQVRDRHGTHSCQSIKRRTPCNAPTPITPTKEYTSTTCTVNITYLQHTVLSFLREPPPLLPLQPCEPLQSPCRQRMPPPRRYPRPPPSPCG